ncbi:putative Glucan endo-1,3-alpha-glucosidase agn1 [Glarea lozoyensis 74030]|uniref:Putative Glucan endo-1,3-alpha-glucosidase agn1 n=1 Tax=Glarea lozoyensis (strain ATCC 74030 / MF5533) TaxID=1104152 RepID=H0ETT2_GLAL7|nr:putative Glucan endo-1,3-alpha-glucosidase agn1 [Glarea lozoyensis 74030]
MQYIFSIALALATLPAAINAKSVFAHIVMGNTAAHDVTLWTKDITLAKEAGIDAFVLNMGFGDSNIPPQVANAFSAAEAAGGGKPWPAGPSGEFSQSVMGILEKYKESPAYFKVENKPFVSTFQGIDNMGDWAPGGTIRSAVGDVFFVPNWDGTGLEKVQAAKDSIEGFFPWGMWPTGASNMTTDNDLHWKNGLEGKSFMMGVSPWFFHSGAGDLKPWVWRGDDLWADRWAQTLEVNPDFVQIVTWNDYGEAHYIGPLPSSESEIPDGSKQYVKDYPHDEWRNFLPYYISEYKNGKGTTQIEKDKLQFWYRTSPNTGNSCGVTGNTASQGQAVVADGKVMEDGIFFSALLKEDSEVSVQIGDGQEVVKEGKKGINHWSVPLGGHTGTPIFSVKKSGLTAKGAEITATSNLEGGCVNFNAFVGGA